jgi:hypothetical protein
MAMPRWCSPNTDIIKPGSRLILSLSRTIPRSGHSQRLVLIPTLAARTAVNFGIPILPILIGLFLIGLWIYRRAR